MCIRDSFYIDFESHQRWDLAAKVLGKAMASPFCGDKCFHYLRISCRSQDSAISKHESKLEINETLSLVFLREEGRRKGRNEVNTEVTDALRVRKRQGKTCPIDAIGSVLSYITVITACLMQY